MREHLNGIETTLVEKMRPYFLAVRYDETKYPFIHVVISHKQFNEMGVVERVSLVYKTLLDRNPDYVSKIPLIVEAFASNEMVDIFEYIK